MTQTEALRLALEALEKISMGGDPRWADQAITAIEAALEAKDEPVAIFKADLDGGYVDLLAFQGQPLSDNTLLYTTPPQRTWVGLTKNEVELLSYMAEGNTWIAVELAEAKLKEKNT